MVKTSDGTMTPELRAAEIVISLLTDPGSYTSVKAVADEASTGAGAGAAPALAGALVRLTGTAGGCLVPGPGMVSSASARTSPVFEFISRAIPCLAFAATMAWA